MSDLANWKPRPAPKPIALTGRHAMIEPFRPGAHEAALWQALGASGINDLIRYFPSGPFSHSGELAAWLQGTAESGNVVNVIRARRSGNIVGMGSFMRADPANGVIEIGSVAHGAAMARSPVATEAHYLLARHVFEELGYRRYEWKCHNDNAASKRSAERLGFTFEGIFRQHMISKGENRDTAWYAMIDREWPRLKAAFEAWLDPVNFDEAGNQKRRLEDIRAGLA